MKIGDYKSFIYLENGQVSFSQYETIKCCKKLESGNYHVEYERYPKDEINVKILEDLESVKTHNFSDKSRIDSLFDSFFDKKVLNKIEKLGFSHKLGILFHGIEGTGKSTIIRHYASRAMKENQAIVFHMANGYRLEKCWSFIQSVRKIQKNPIVVIFDELDGIMEDNEAIIKSIIDGNMSISNCIFLAATNYMDKIPKALTERPSRFKYCINVEGMQVVEDIVSIIKPILREKMNDDEIKNLALKLKGNTLDYIKQFCFDELMSITHYGKKKKSIGF